MLALCDHPPTNSAPSPNSLFPSIPAERSAMVPGFETAGQKANRQQRERAKPCSPPVTQKLERVETNDPPRRKKRLEYTVPPVGKYDTPQELRSTLTPVEEKFRHSGWAARRQRVAVGLAAAGVSFSRLENFLNCGHRCAVLQDQITHHLKPIAGYCHDRFCYPCQAARAAALQAALHRRVPTARALHVVLTLRSSERSLSEQVTEILKSFTKLRSTKFWKGRAQGGFWAFEVTKNDTTGLWHPHIHCLVHADWIPQDQLSEQWSKITHGSSVVHVSLVEKHDSAIREVTKYLAKPLHRSVEFNPETIVEVIKCLKGRHLCGTFGSWRKDPLLNADPPETPGEWKFVATLNRLSFAAANGDAWAQYALKYLAAQRPGAEPLTPPPLAPDG